MEAPEGQFRNPHSAIRNRNGERSSIWQSTGLWLQGLRVRVPPFTPRGELPDGDRAPVAQSDRAAGFEPAGREFDPLRARHAGMRISDLGFRMGQVVRRVGSVRDPKSEARRAPVAQSGESDCLLSSGSGVQIAPGAPAGARRFRPVGARGALRRGPAQCGPLAQVVEQLTLNQRVQGSSPWRPTNSFFISIGHATVSRSPRGGDPASRVRSVDVEREWRNGRRAGLRIQSQRWGGGSTPLSRTRCRRATLHEVA